MLRYLKWIALIALGIALLVGIVGTVFGWMGCGSVKLEMVFQVVDHHTGLPIEGAEIQISSWEGFPFQNEERSREQVKVSVQTNEDGEVWIFAGERFATMSGNAFHTTLDGVRLPNWQYRISAVGYIPLEDSGCGYKYALLQERTDHGTVKQIIRWRIVREPAD